MVAVDTGFLALIFYPAARPSTDPGTGLATERLSERINKLVNDLDRDRERVIVPTPAIAEFLVVAQDGAQQYLAELTSNSSFLIRAFDLRAAIEVAAMEVQARKFGSKRAPAAETSPWQKVKVDRQIVAIAKLNGTQTLYSDDRDVRNIAEDVGVKVVSSWELEIPASTAAQLNLLPSPEEPS